MSYETPWLDFNARDTTISIILVSVAGSYFLSWERSGSVVECLARDRGTAGSSLTGVTALWSLSKTHLFYTDPK